MLFLIKLRASSLRSINFLYEFMEETFSWMKHLMQLCNKFVDILEMPCSPYLQVVPLHHPSQSLMCFHKNDKDRVLLGAKTCFEN